MVYLWFTRLFHLFYNWERYFHMLGSHPLQYSHWIYTKSVYSHCRLKYVQKCGPNCTSIAKCFMNHTLHAYFCILTLMSSRHRYIRNSLSLSFDSLHCVCPSSHLSCFLSSGYAFTMQISFIECNNCNLILIYITSKEYLIYV